jgi:hypothetical protein
MEDAVMDGFVLNTIIELDEEMSETLGEYRLRKIVNAVHAAAGAEIQLAYLTAVSGAMRWPVGLRPEVMICAEARML